jgi:histidinol-phosphate aminotransferase
VSRPRAGGAAARGLFRHPGPIDPYPAEPSDEELAAAVGLDVSAIVRMDMNTLGGGPLPAVAAALADGGQVVEYNDLGYRALRAAISAATGAPAARIIPGAGGDELIRLLTAVAVGPGDAVVVPTPTFPMFAVEAALAGGQVVAVPRALLRERQSVDAIRDAAVSSSARLVWICSPNNPTGDLTPLAEIEAIADGLPALVVVDEVYVELAEAAAGVAPGDLSAIALVDRMANLVVLRSLSKAYGLAAARVGYLVADDAVATRLDGSRLPLPIAGPSDRLARAALADPAAARARHELLGTERARLDAAFDGLGWERLPSVANFVLFRPPDAGALAGDLHRRGIVLRAYGDGPLSGWLRVTVRSPAENDRFLAAIRAD